MLFVRNLKNEAAKEEYLRHRLANVLESAPQEFQENFIKTLSTSDPFSSQPFFEPIQHLEKLDGIEVAIENSKADYPLSPNETIVEEELYAVANDSPSLEAAPIVLRQETNLGESFILIPNYELQSGAISSVPEVGIEAPTEDLTTTEVEPLAVPPWVLKLGKTLGSKLLEVIGSQIWGWVKKEVLNQPDISDMEKYYVKLVEQMEMIIDERFNQADTTKLRGAAKTFDITISDWNATGRYEDLQSAKNKVRDLLGYADALGEVGTFDYADATLLHIMCLQEDYRLAKEQGASPERLKTLRTHISSSATNYARIVRTKHDALLVSRLAAISTSPLNRPTVGEWAGGQSDWFELGVRFGHHLYWQARGCPSGCRTMPLNYQLVGLAINYFEDKRVRNRMREHFWHAVSWAGHWHESKHNWAASWGSVNSALMSYRTTVRRNLHNNLQGMRDIAAALDALAQKPVGKE